MIVLGDDERSIEISFNDSIYVRTSKKTYRIELPTVICSNKADAQYIQNQINEFVVALGYSLLEKKKNEN